MNSEAHRFAAWGLEVDDLNWERRRYTGLKSYGSAKLAQLLSMFVFEEHYKGSGVTINSMHPGAVKTDSGKDNGPVYRWFKKNFFDKTLRAANISAEAIYYLGVSKEIEGVSGKALNQLSRDNNHKNSKIVACFEEITLEGLLYIMAIARKNHVKKAVSLYVTTLRHVEASLSGNDLMEMGYKPGPRFKKILMYLKNIRLDNLALGPEEAAALVQKKFPRQ